MKIMVKINVAIVFFWTAVKPCLTFSSLASSSDNDIHYYNAFYVIIHFFFSIAIYIMLEVIYIMLDYVRYTDLLVSFAESKGSTWVPLEMMLCKQMDKKIFNFFFFWSILFYTHCTSWPCKNNMEGKCTT